MATHKYGGLRYDRSKKNTTHYSDEFEGICGTAKQTEDVNKELQGVQLKSGPYFNMSNLFINMYNMLYYTTSLYLQ